MAEAAEAGARRSRACRLHGGARCAVWLALVACAALLACGDGSRDLAPADVVRRFLELMDRSAIDESALQDAYQLLETNAQKALAARAERARALSGRKYAPWQMLAQGRFRLRFAPRPGMDERVNGEHAVVVVHGSHAGERADVPLVRERGTWRIVLALPPMRNEGSAARQGDG